MAYGNKSKLRPSLDQSSFEPVFNLDANASINNLFNGNSLFGPQFGGLDSSPPSIPLNQPQDVHKRGKDRFKPSGPEALNVTVEYEGKKEEKFVFKGVKADYDAHGHLLLAPIIDKIRTQGFESKGHVIMHYSPNYDAFVFVDRDPIPAAAAIAPDDLDPTKPLRLKFRPAGDSSDETQQRAPRREPESLQNANSYSNILSAVKLEDDVVRGRLTKEAGQPVRARQVKEREKIKDKEMLHDLKKTLPNTESQHQ